MDRPDATSLSGVLAGADSTLQDDVVERAVRRCSDFVVRQSVRNRPHCRCSRQQVKALKADLAIDRYSGSDLPQKSGAKSWDWKVFLEIGGWRIDDAA
ncbi:hypothetical protein [Luteimonas sp. R10]|uniref:hypothetical protein n=1 Tax=Luteimonas sp. R10 TaxID=3108176 RepID=UPI003090D5B9|nr:hypothetical protein U3649_17035 [Luteimonas sp. R10]